ncbi:hypothetical protein DXD79_13635 [Hungatella hathewayi]|uniref:Uncharacterized protein n=1 Tax=Hungatella hathewayi TaxID=154046 RepID=A0A374P7Y1_9FIRM|nr:hypothetical protein DXD79_13635 [Hungatella hathewayi]RGK98815.1 hypothetical protein DXC88_05140 [Hungatella hathewayi]RHC53232.1 hypothetical protein DW841_03715 [Hungatella hathewayi]
MKIHSRHLPAPLRGIFAPNSVSVAHYASFIGVKSLTKCDAQLTESNFQTRSKILPGRCGRSSCPVPLTALHGPDERAGWLISALH